MHRSIPILVLLCPLIGCQPAESGNLPSIAFSETVGAGQYVRELEFELTNNPAKTCIAGRWNAARPLVDKENYTKSAAYRWEGRKLEVLLNTTKCDSYDSYIGSVSGRTFKGTHVLYGLGSSNTLGGVAGIYTNR